jgi:hypothetical protein
LGQLGAVAGSVGLGACGKDESLVPAAPRPSFYFGVGIENTWMVQADPASDGPRRALDEFALTGHDAQWRADLQLATGLGVNCVRYSLPWPRIETAPRVYDFTDLRVRMEFFASLGIVPILDLIHYGTPEWMQAGIGDPRFVDSLADYARRSAEQLSGLVTHFTPYNEPQVAAALCGATGTWPPYGNTPARFAELGVRIARAMVSCSRSLRSVLPHATLISADPINWQLADALFPDLDEDDADEALRAAVGSFPASLAYGMVPPGHPLFELLLQLGVSAAELEWLAKNGEPPDIVGYNHYPDIVDFPHGPDFTLGGSLPLEQAAYAAGARVERGLRRAQAYFGGSIYLTETSAGLTTGARAAYATALGGLTARLRDDGFPLVGLNWWPLVQAVQWDYRDRVGQPLGDFFVPGGWNNALYDVHMRNDGSLERIATPAVEAFRSIAPP